MNQRMLIPLLVAPLLGLCQVPGLLTENGLTNSNAVSYQKAQRLPTGGKCTASPPFASDGENPATLPFSESRLTNGDPSFAYRNVPSPYSYWQGLGRGEVEFDLGQPYRLHRVRVCILNSGPHGTERIELYRRGDPLEFPEALKLAELHAKNGWNEFAELDAMSDGVRIRFTAQPGKAYITISEVEIWGTEAPPQTVSATPKRANAKAILENGIEWYAFDFGPAASPVFANFTGVSRDTGYTDEKGYGFLPSQGGEQGTVSNFGPDSKTIPGLHERDRVGKKASYTDDLYRDFVMTSQYYHTQVRQTFAIDVPNGIYRVMTFHGDEKYGRTGRQCWWIEAEGKRVVEELIMPRSHRADAGFTATVSDGQLNVTFDADDPEPAGCGFLLNALVAFPVNTPAEKAFSNEKSARLLAALKRERDDRFTAVFREIPYTEEAEMPTVTGKDQQRGFVVFVPHWLATVYPNSVPRPADLKRPLSCFACPGEYEPLTVAVHALQDLKGARCTVGDLVGPETLPGSVVEVRSVSCWPQRVGSSWGTEWQVMPELLELSPSVDVPARTTQEFWLTIRVPEKVRPGTYQGAVSLSTNAGMSVQIPLVLEVLPFTLHTNERPVGMYWYEHKVANTPRRDIQVRDMIDHGMTTLTMGNLFPAVTNDGGKLALDVDELLHFLQELRTLGIAGPIPYHTSGLMTKIKRTFPDAPSPDHDALYVEAIRQLEAVSSRPDTPKLLYYPVDEIGNHEERGRKANHECALVARVPGATSYITVNNYKAGEKWGDTFDIWCGNIEYKAPDEETLLNKGKRYMRYGPAYLNSARKARNSCGFGFYRRPAEAMFYWHYQCFQGDPNNDFDGTCRDHCAAYPGDDDRPIPTIDWEALREGIDDMKYIATLKHYAAQAARIAGGKTAAKRAMDALNDVLGGDERVNQYTFRDDLSDDEYHALRRKLVDAILKLRTVLGE